MPKGYTLLTTYDIWKLLPSDGPGITTKQLATRVRGFTGGNCQYKDLHTRLKVMVTGGRVSATYEATGNGVRMVLKRGKGAAWKNSRALRTVAFLQARGWMA